MALLVSQSFGSFCTKSSLSIFKFLKTLLARADLPLMDAVSRPWIKEIQVHFAFDKEKYMYILLLIWEIHVHFASDMRNTCTLCFWYEKYMYILLQIWEIHVHFDFDKEKYMNILVWINDFFLGQYYLYCTCMFSKQYNIHVHILTVLVNQFNMCEIWFIMSMYTHCYKTQS